MNELQKTKMLLATYKEYKRAEYRLLLPSALSFIVMVYIFSGAIYFFGARVINSYAHRIVSRLIRLEVLKPSAADQFREATSWDILESYTMGHPIIAGFIVVLLLVVSITIFYKVDKVQKRIKSHIDEEELIKDYEEVKLRQKWRG